MNGGMQMGARAALWLLVATVTACSSGSDNGTGPGGTTPPVAAVSTVAVSVGSTSLVAGSTTLATATARDGAGVVIAGRTVSWSSAAPSIAAVDGAGTITAVAPGTAVITASVDGRTGSASITVTAVPAASVTVTLAATALGIGGTTQATAVVRDAAGAPLSGRAVTWSSSAQAVATVSSTGFVTAVSAGTTVISAISEGRTGTASLTVSPPAVASLTIAFAPVALVVGGSVQATATARDATGAELLGRAITWTSSALDVATVSASGLVSGVGVGTVVITARAENQSATATVMVARAPVATVGVSLPAASLAVGRTQQPTVTLRDAAGTALSGRVITWTSSTPAVATVSETGLIVTFAPGATTITATSEGQSGTASLTVVPATVATVSVAPATIALTVGQGRALSATVRDDIDNVLLDRIVSWSSNNPSVAAVSATGVITGIAAGAATVTATSGGRSGSAAVSVTAVTAATVTLNLGAFTMVAGEFRTIIATIRDAGGTVLSGRNVAWTSSNLSVVDGYVIGDTVVVTGLTSGVATVTATVDGRSASVPINVVVPATNICTQIAGASLVSSTGVFLGTFTNRFNSQSIFNEFGTYGSQYAALSTNNPYGTYGSPYSATSARNPYASSPPVIVKNGSALAFYTVNTTKTPSVAPAYAATCNF